jgi:hypothetical protein
MTHYSLEELTLLHECLKAEGLRGIDVLLLGPSYNTIPLSSSAYIKPFYKMRRLPTPQVYEERVLYLNLPGGSHSHYRGAAILPPTEDTPGAYSLNLAQTLKCTYLKHAWGVYNTELYQLIFTKPLSIMPKLIYHKVPYLKAIAKWRLQLGK